MGTSRGYNPPTGGGWPPLKRQVTQYGKEGGNPGGLPEDSLSPRQLLSNYIAVCGGSSHISSGNGGAGGAGNGRGESHATRTIWRAATRVGQNLGSFASRVGQVGLANALRDFNLGDLVGRPASIIASALIDRLAGPGSTLDRTLARIALNKLRQELLAHAKTFEDVERAFVTTLEQRQVAGLVIQYYGYYLYERFCRDFYEQLIKKVGVDRARRSIESIRLTIFSSLRAKVANRDPLTIDWRGAEGRQLAERILGETLHIFEANV